MQFVLWLRVRRMSGRGGAETPTASPRTTGLGIPEIREASGAEEAIRPLAGRRIIDGSGLSGRL